MTTVEVDENGLPTSRNSTSMGHFKGTLIRTHIPISYKSWKNVPQKHKEDVWSELQEFYKIPETSKATIVKGMSEPWRRLKFELRRDFYDKLQTHEERILNLPPGIKQEDWVLFCENENTPEAMRSREENKRKREKYLYNHTSGCKPHSLVKAELETKNPGVEITPSAVWLATHQQAGGNILPSAQPYYEKLQKAEEEIKEQQNTSTPASPIDALTKAFGSDSRGRVRGVGAVSRTQYDHSAAARAKVVELKSKDGDLNQEVKELGSKMVSMIEGIGALCNIIKDMKSGQGSSSYNVDSSQGSPSTTSAFVPAPASQHTSPSQILLSLQGFSHAPSTAVGAATRCSLLNLDGETIAVGTLCTDDLGDVCHGSPVSPNNVKVLLDQILLPEESTIKANNLARTFQDVGVGGYVVHPKICVRYG